MFREYRYRIFVFSRMLEPTFMYHFAHTTQTNTNTPIGYLINLSAHHPSVVGQKMESVFGVK